MGWSRTLVSESHKRNHSRTIKLTLEYDGTDFAGWQVQPHQRTVQGVIESCLFSLTKQTIRIIGSGRTDAGVHALGQVASFEVEGAFPIRVFKEGLNSLLPPDVRVKEAGEADIAFNARRDAIKRTYRYILSRVPIVVGRQYAWYPGEGIALEPMKTASEILSGMHDFTSFCKAEDAAEAHPSLIHEVDWKAHPDTYQFEITANRFFHHMIRVLIGTLIDVGKGKRTPEDFRAILDARDRNLAGITAPPNGLFLMRVLYDSL